MKVRATEIKNFFGKYLEQCKAEPILITKNDRVVAKLSAYEESTDGSLMLKEGSNAYSSASKRVTYEEFRRIADHHDDRFEYIGGEIYLMSSPGITHQLIHTHLYACLIGWFKGKKCQVFSAPFDVTLVNEEQDSSHVVQPDLLISCDYLEKHDANDRYTGIPALVIEIISPQTRSLDQVKKLNVYLDSGIREYWVVDPRDRRVTLYSFVEKQLEDMNLIKYPDVVKSIHFKGLEVSTTDIFGE